MTDFDESIAPAAAGSSRHFLHRQMPVAGVLIALLFAGCAEIDDAASLSGDVALSPSAVLVPQDQVLETAKAFSQQQTGGFVQMNFDDALLPRYVPGTAFVAEFSDYTALRRGMIVVAFDGTQRVVRVLVRQTPTGWTIRAFNSKVADPAIMTPARYVGTVVMAFSPEAPKPDEQAQTPIVSTAS